MVLRNHIYEMCYQENPMNGAIFINFSDFIKPIVTYNVGGRILTFDGKMLTHVV